MALGRIGVAPRSVVHPSPTVLSDAVGLLKSFGQGETDLAALLAEIKEAQDRNIALIAEAQEKIGEAHAAVDQANADMAEVERASAAQQQQAAQDRAAIAAERESLSRDMAAFEDYRARQMGDLSGREAAVAAREREAAATAALHADGKAQLDERERMLGVKTAAADAERAKLADTFAKLRAILNG